MHAKLAILCLSSSLFAAACGPSADHSGHDDHAAKADGASSADKAKSSADKGKAAAPKSTAVDLPDLGLTGDGPAPASVSGAIGGKGHMVMAPGLVVTVTDATGRDPKTLADAKAAASDYSPTDVAEETLADGWVLTYVNKGSMGANYWVTARRTIDGKDFVCSTTASEPAQQTNAVAFCKSLKKK